MSIKKILIYTFSFLFFLSAFTLFTQTTFAQADCSKASADTLPACTTIDTGELGFKIPTLGDILTFVIRAFFVIAGLAALFYMLLGAFAWVTSGGEAEAVGGAQQKIQAAVVGMLIIVGVLAIIWTLEQVIFNRKICLGLSCPLTLPGIIESKAGAVFCCTCVNETTGALGATADINTHTCQPDGSAKSK